MAINKRERNLLILTITLVVLGLNYILVVPLFQGWTKVNHDLLYKQDDLTRITKTIAHAPEWQLEYIKLGQSLGQAEHFDAISDVLKKIDEIGLTSGVQMQSKRSLRVEEHDVYREWPVQCTFESSTESLVKFLVGLQSGSGFMTVEQLSVVPKPDNTGILRCDIQIRALAAKGERPAS